MYLRKSPQLALLPLLLLIGAPAFSFNQVCAPVVGPNCTYDGCHIDYPGGPTVLSRVQVGEVACARCDSVVEMALYGHDLPGAGYCNSTGPASRCVGGGDWCNCVQFGACGGGTPGFFPPICDPPHAHGPEPNNSLATGSSIRTAPRRWTFDLDGVDYLVMLYNKTQSTIPLLTDEDSSLICFVSNPDQTFGVLGRGRYEMAGSLYNLLLVLNEGHARNELIAAAGPPDISLNPGASRTAPLVTVGDWEVRWTALPPVTAPSFGQAMFFPASPYPCLWHHGQPATIADLRKGDVRPQSVP